MGRGVLFLTAENVPTCVIEIMKMFCSMCLSPYVRITLHSGEAHN